MSRIMLTGPTDFYVDPNGNDTTGDGSLTNPWASPMGAFDHLATRYDLTKQVATIYVANGTYTQTNQFSGPIVGQAGADYLRFIGNLTNPSLCKIKPSSGYAFSVDQGAGCQIAGFHMDSRDASNDMIAIGQFSTMIWDNKLIFGPVGPTMTPWNHASVNGYLKILAGTTGNPKGYLVAPELKYTTWSGGPLTNLLSVDDVAGIKLYQGVNGAYMNDNPAAYVTAIDVPNKLVTISTPTSNIVPVSNVGVNFSNGAQCHILAGEGGVVQYTTDGNPGLFNINVQYAPYFSTAFMCAYQGGLIDCSGISFTSNATGRRYLVERNGIIDTLGAGENYLPGTMNGIKNTGGIYA